MFAWLESFLGRNWTTSDHLTIFVFQIVAQRYDAVDWCVFSLLRNGQNLLCRTGTTGDRRSCSTHAHTRVLYTVRTVETVLSKPDTTTNRFTVFISEIPVCWRFLTLCGRNFFAGLAWSGRVLSQLGNYCWSLLSIILGVVKHLIYWSWQRSLPLTRRRSSRREQSLSSVINISNFSVLVDHHGVNRRVLTHVWEGGLREQSLSQRLVSVGFTYTAVVVLFSFGASTWREIDRETHFPDNFSLRCSLQSQAPTRILATFCQMASLSLLYTAPRS